MHSPNIGSDKIHESSKGSLTFASGKIKMLAEDYISRIPGSTDFMTKSRKMSRYVPRFGTKFCTIQHGIIL